MTEYYYNTTIPILKATRIINSRIIVSLVLIWVALGSAVFFLLSQQNSGNLLKNLASIKKPAAFTNDKTVKESANGAFVLVIRNQKLTLTTYTAYIDSAETNTIPDESIAVNKTSAGASPVVIKVKNDNSTDFSVKRVPQ